MSRFTISEAETRTLREFCSQPSSPEDARVMFFDALNSGSDHRWICQALIPHLEPALSDPNELVLAALCYHDYDLATQLLAAGAPVGGDLAEQMLAAPDDHTPTVAQWLVGAVPGLIPEAYQAFVLDVALLTPVALRRYLRHVNPGNVYPGAEWFLAQRPYLYLAGLPEAEAIQPSLQAVLPPDLVRYGSQATRAAPMAPYVLRGTWTVIGVGGLSSSV